jgi:aryl-phospho-beta-D-glucosidase BglC (GH1 family)
MNTTSFLKINGSQIVGADNQPVVLRGTSLGGWMMMENFITGYSASEQAQRQAILDVLGRDKYEFFFDRFLEYFFTADDARFLQSLGFNLLRLPFNYRHFEDDMRPFEIKEAGFKHLDRAINLCAEHGIYTILDLHALPGCQNISWHSDNPTHVGLFWQHKHFQDRTVHLWETIAARYKDNPWVAGYNPMNEPYDPTERMIEPIYRRLVDALRAIDPHHLIFLEGNRYSKDFHMFGDPLPGVVYTNHDYAVPGLMEGGPYPGYTAGKYYDNEALHETFVSLSKYMLDHRVPIWVGEFGPVYTGNAEADAMRYQILHDQLEIYKHYQVNWAIWLHKDIGLHGITSVAPESPWRRRVQSFVAKKARLATDVWGAQDTQIRHLIEPLEQTFAVEFPNYNPGPYGGGQHRIKRLVRNILLAEALLPEFAELFRGMSETEIDEMMQSFLFKNCIVRQPLAKMLAEYTH